MIPHTNAYLLVYLYLPLLSLLICLLIDLDIHCLHPTLVCLSKNQHLLNSQKIYNLLISFLWQSILISIYYSCNLSISFCQKVNLFFCQIFISVSQSVLNFVTHNHFFSLIYKLWVIEWQKGKKSYVMLHPSKGFFRLNNVLIEEIVYGGEAMKYKTNISYNYVLREVLKIQGHVILNVCCLICLNAQSSWPQSLFYGFCCSFYHCDF